MEESQIAAQQAEMIGLLLNILQGLIIICLGALGWWLRTLSAKVDENKSKATDEREMNLKEFMTFKEGLAKELASIKSDLRSNKEQDSHIDKQLEEMQSDIKSMRETVTTMQSSLMAFIQEERSKLK